MISKKLKLLTVAFITVFSVANFSPVLSAYSLTTNDLQISESELQQDSTLINDVNLKALPTKYDSRSLGYVTPVRDQGQIGDCWAFGAIGALETAMKKQYGKTVDYSEINMAANNGIVGPMDGGNDIIAASYLTSWQGPVLENDDPYPSPAIESNINSNKNAKAQYHIQNIPMNIFDMSVGEIKQMVYKYGAATTQVASKYINPANGATNNNVDYYETDHEILIVGWDDNYSRNNFKNKPTNNGAFICKNSWGTGYGDKGYLYVSYEDKSLLEGGHMAFNKVESTTNYKNIYGGTLNADLKEDYYLWNDYEKIYYVFQMDKLGTDEMVSALGMYIPLGTGSSKIRYVENFDKNNISNRNITEYASKQPVIQTTSISENGYYTVKLNKPIIPKNKSNYAFIVEVPIGDLLAQKALKSTGENASTIDIIKDCELTNKIFSKSKSVKLGTLITAGRVYVDSTKNTKITSFTTSVPSGAKVGTKIKVSATSNLAGSYYEFYAKSSTSTSWTKIKGMGPLSYGYWTPSKPGTYTLRVRAKGPNSSNSYDSYKDITFTVE